jgi:hypothetical protein
MSQPEIVKQISDPHRIELHWRFGFASIAGPAREPIPDAIRTAIEAGFWQHTCLPPGTLDPEQ